MVEKLLELQKNAYCNYSNFPVSAIVVTKDGKEFCGVNVEDASYRAGACAERVALFSMISNGKIGTPCFVCRQMIVELCDNDTIINCYSTTGEKKTYTKEELCPYPFSEEDLNN